MMGYIPQNRSFKYKRLKEWTMSSKTLLDNLDEFDSSLFRDMLRDTITLTLGV